MSLPETNWRFKTGLDSSGGSRGAENTRCMSEAGATGLTDGCRQRREGEQGIPGLWVEKVGGERCNLGDQGKGEVSHGSRDLSFLNLQIS